MRGLIIKDLLYIKSTWKNLTLMFIGSLLISIAAGNYTLAIVIVPMMLLTTGISTFQTDEFFNVESYTLSLPLTRKQIIISKYLFTLIMMVISTIIGLIIYGGIKVIADPGYRGLNVYMIRTLLMLELSGLIVDSIFYPIIYRFGCEKSRLVLMSIIMLLLGIGSIVSVYVNVFDKYDSIDWEGIINWIEANGVLTLSIISVTLIILSYILSNVLYRKRDF